jgi:hypothetical protein
MFGILFGDNLYEVPRTAIARSTGVHRVASLIRKQDISVEVVDFSNSWTIDELSEFLNKFQKINFIGFGLSLSQLDVEKVNTIIDISKKINPSVKVIAGGSSVLDNQYIGIDLFFKGFTEGAMDDIIGFLKTGKINPFVVESIKTHDVKKVVNCTHHYPKFDLSHLKNEYTDRDFIHHNESLTLEFSRGCIFKCKFCNFPLVGKKKNDYIREKEDIKQELIENYKKWGITKYTITDDTFNDNEIKVDMLYEITKELDFKLSLFSYARVDLLHAKEGSLDKLVQSGLKGFFFGIESLNERTSRKIGKGLTGDKLKNYLIEIKRKYPELHLTGSFIIGLPYEPFGTFDSNLDWAVSNNIFTSYNFYPLSIPIDNKINYMSPFSYEWKDYGYTLMSNEEVSDIIDSSLVKETMSKYRYLLKDHTLPWKNEFMNIVDAIAHSQYCKKKVHGKSSVSGFMAMAQSFNNHSVNGVINLKKTEIDWEKQIKDTTDFVNEYKSKKLKWQ